MRLTSQQALVLFDIAKCAMNQMGGFAGYSNEEIMKLINQIISQQDNVEIVPLINNTIKNGIDITKAEDLATNEPTMNKEDFWD